jgi:hypothetical protein
MSKWGLPFTVAVLGLGFQALSAPSVTLTVTPFSDAIRFRAEGPVQQLRLEVLSLSGQRVFDSGFITHTVLDWKLANSQGQPVATGIYLYIVTVKDESGNVEKKLGKLVVQRAGSGSTHGRVAASEVPLPPPPEPREPIDPIIRPTLFLFWNLKGNAGTNPAQNFLGTTDNISLVFRTNNVERMRLSNAGDVGIGTNSPLAKLHVAGGLRLDGDLLCPAPCIHSADIADGQVSVADLADGAVNSAKILDGSIATLDLADGAVTLAKLAADSVDASKILDGSVGSADVNSSQVQVRVTGECGTGSAIRTINADGTVACESVGGCQWPAGRTTAAWCG